MRLISVALLCTEPPNQNQQQSLAGAVGRRPVEQQPVVGAVARPLSEQQLVPNEGKKTSRTNEGASSLNIWKYKNVKHFSFHY